MEGRQCILKQSINSGPPDETVTWGKAPAAQRDMGNAAATPAKESSSAEAGQSTQEENQSNFFMATMGKGKKPKTCCTVMRIIYVILSIITIFKCIAVIAVAVSTAIATKSFSVQQSGRVVAMIILAVTAAVALSVIIYSMMGVFRKQTRPLHAAAVVLIILAIIQAIISGVSVNFTSADEANLSRALLESFNLAKEENLRHTKLWATTQSDLTCCGVYGSEDYRTPGLPLYFPPNVPISCCPSYDGARSELLQERERENCKARREYYDQGCRAPVVQLFQYTARIVLGVTISLIIFEILLSINGLVISHKQKKKDASLEEKK